ncbi:MAG TPA: hypothetical protein VKF42_02800 [Chitinivibrionales bacterium]|jgi:hypothetical protein|nr:hypothetical protein [Chitinivibrionales bacterium]
MIPSVMNLKIHSGERFKLRLWLPLFIIWPFVLVVLLLLLPFLVLAEIVLRLANARIYLFAIIGALFSLISAMQGLTVRVNNEKHNSLVHVTIR